MKANFQIALLLLIGIISSCNSKPEKEPDTSALLGAGFGISNAIVIVQNFDSTRNYYAKVLGFNIPKAEKSQKEMYDGTITTSFNFPDFSSVTLLSVKDTPVVAVKDSFITDFWKHHEGVRVYSLFTSSVDTTRKWLTAQGFKTDSSRSGRFTTAAPKGWDWDDGGMQWRTIAINSNNPAPNVPGFMEIVGMPYEEIQASWKPASWRKYFENHPNGVVGISSLRIVVSELNAACKEFEQIGLKQLVKTDSFASFKLPHNQQLHLIVPKSTGDEYSKFLKRRGPGVYAICFETRSFKETHAFLKKNLPASAFHSDSLLKRVTVSKEHAFGVQLEFTEESKEQSALAKVYDYKEGSKLDTASLSYAAGMYTKYCALCHGKNREGYAADFAPSLRSHSLMATTQSPGASFNYLSHTISYGRPGTAMAPYSKDQGGPLDGAEIELLITWLHQLSGVKKAIALKTEPITGDIPLGKILYGKHCAACHGLKGEGVRAPALANPMLLATASDAFLRYTITEGRDSTPMPSFKDSLSKGEINSVTAYLRSRASGWNTPEAIIVKEPVPAEYVINPSRQAPQFTLREGRYVSAKQVLKALKDSSRMMILDARSTAAWQQTHIPGAISVPYYKEPDKFIKDIPNDSTWIVTYCACPHAASTQVVNTLKRFGYKHTAILDEGILVWAQKGYPVQYGQTSKKKKSRN